MGSEATAAPVLLSSSSRLGACPMYSVQSASRAPSAPCSSVGQAASSVERVTVTALPANPAPVNVFAEALSPCVVAPPAGAVYGFCGADGPKTLVAAVAGVALSTPAASTRAAAARIEDTVSPKYTDVYKDRSGACHAARTWSISL